MEVTDVSTNTEPEVDGKIVFANDVIATIASLAAAEVEGISSMGNCPSESFFGKKNTNKGIKVEVGTEEAAVDVYVNIYYGYRVQQVCFNIQKSIKDAIETMTGLCVVEVNVYVQSVVFKKAEESAQEKNPEIAEKCTLSQEEETAPEAEENDAEEAFEADAEVLAEEEAAYEEAVCAEETEEAVCEEAEAEETDLDTEFTEEIPAEETEASEE